MIFDSDKHLNGLTLDSEKGWKKAGKILPTILEVLCITEDSSFMELTSLQQRYLLGYALKDINGWSMYHCYQFAKNRPFTHADISAGVGATTLQNIPEVQEWIKKIDWARIKAMGFNSERIIEEEVSLAYSDITEFLDEDHLLPIKKLKSLPPAIRRTIKSFEVIALDDGTRKYKLSVWDKGQSLNRLQKIKGMHSETIKVKSDNVNLNINTDMDAQEAAKMYSQMIKEE